MACWVLPPGSVTTSLPLAKATPEKLPSAASDRPPCIRLRLLMDFIAALLSRSETGSAGQDLDIVGIPVDADPRAGLQQACRIARQRLHGKRDPRLNIVEHHVIFDDVAEIDD